MLKILETKYKIRQLEVMQQSYDVISKEFLIQQAIFPSYAFFWKLPENRLRSDISLRQRRLHLHDYMNIDWTKFPAEEKLYLCYKKSDRKSCYFRGDFVEIEDKLYISPEESIVEYTIESSSDPSIKHKWCIENSEKARVNAWALEVLFEDFESLAR